MEFWCLVKEYLNYGDYDRDVVVEHYKTEFKGLDEFFKYINMYVNDNELKEDEYDLETKDDSYCFSYYDDYVSVSVCLDKVTL